jgi:hypothetical protein
MVLAADVAKRSVTLIRDAISIFTSICSVTVASQGGPTGRVYTGRVYTGRVYTGRVYTGRVYTGRVYMVGRGNCRPYVGTLRASAVRLESAGAIGTVAGCCGFNGGHSAVFRRSLM